MKDKKKIYFVILGLTVLLLSIGSLHAEPVPVTENLRGETVLLPPSTPERDQLVLVSFVTIAPEAEVVAAIAVYDDPQSRWSVDYMGLGVFCWLVGLTDSASAGLPWTADFFKRRPPGSKEFLSFFKKGPQYKDRRSGDMVLTEDRSGLAA